MEVNLIEKKLEEFEDSNLKSIMIDGPWGCGKTTQILNYCESVKKRKCSNFIYYISLFGYKSIDEIHTKIYKMVHYEEKNIKMRVESILPAIDLIPYCGSALEKIIANSIKLEKDKEQKYKIDSKNKKIIIIDDFERMDNSIGIANIMGYFHQLFMNGFKLVIVCDSTHFRFDNDKKNEYFSFKEKVIDKEIRITKTNYQVINDIFDYNNISTAIKNNFEENIRFAERTKYYYDKILKFSNDTNKRLVVSKDSILWYLSLIIPRINSISQQKEKEKDTQYYEVLKDIGENSAQLIEKDRIINLVLEKDRKVNNEYRLENCFSQVYSSTLVNGIYDVIIYDDYTGFEDSALVDNNRKIEKDIFYYGNEEKKRMIYDIINNAILSNDKINDIEIEKIRSIFKYKKLFPEIYDEDKLINKIIDRTSDLSKEYYPMYLYNDNSDVSCFFKKLDKKRIEKHNYELVAELVNNSNSNLKKFTTCFDKVVHSGYNYDENSSEFKNDIKELFRINNYFIPNLCGEINEEDWRKAHHIIDKLKLHSIISDVKKYLINKKEVTNDLDEAERLTYLINKC